MVNYDLPWNPNRIEQRFGRIHRIGQSEVCRLWNLVADDTREGEVFTRLLAKIEEQRKAYGGKVFDVLGDGVRRTTAARPADRRDPLRRRPRRARANMKVIDAGVPEGIEELLAERALATDAMQTRGHRAMRALMDEARARRLQPHYIARSPDGVHALGRQDRAARSAALRDHTRPGAAAHASAAPRSPPATSASRSTSSTMLDETAPPSCSPPATRCTTPSPTRPSPPPTRAQPRHRPRLADREDARACSSASSRRSPTHRAAVGALQLRAFIATGTR